MTLPRIATRVRYGLLLLWTLVPLGLSAVADPSTPAGGPHGQADVNYWSLLTVFLLATFIGLGVIASVSRLLHTPLMSLTNAISAIAVVGAIIVTGPDYPD